MKPQAFKIYIGGVYHFVAADKPGPWRTMCDEHVVRSVETKNPGAATCSKCEIAALELIEANLSRPARPEAELHADLAQLAKDLLSVWEAVIEAIGPAPTRSRRAILMGIVDRTREIDRRARQIERDEILRVHARCDGQHAAPRCSDSQCWRDDEPAPVGDGADR